MPLPVRHGDAPYRGRETLFGADMEQDIASLFSVFNALADVNVSPSAQINGTKLSDASIVNAKLRDGSVAGDRFADDAITAAKIVDGTIDSRALAQGAALAYTYSEFTTDVPLTTSWATVLTAGHTTGLAGSKVLLLASSTYESVSTYPIGKMQLRFARDAGVLYTPSDFARRARSDADPGDTNFAGASSEITLCYLDSAHPAGTAVAYTLDSQATINAKHTLTGARLLVLEFRR
jgi:hypothetical protein